MVVFQSNLRGNMSKNISNLTTNPKIILVNMSLIFVIIIITIAFAEVVLRFTPYQNIASSYKYPSQYFVYDEQIGYDITKNRKDAIHSLKEHPYEVFSNSYGCFDYDREVPDNYGIIVGDSFTWGYTPLEYKWTTYLEEKSNIFMMKCGITGHGTAQEMIKAKRVIKAVGKSPKYIIVLYTANDFNNDFFFPSRIVIGNGTLVSKSRGVNFLTGERFFYSNEQIQKRNEEHKSFKYKLVTYRLFISAKQKIIALISGKKTTNKEFGKMPDFVENYYDVSFADYFNYKDRIWYNEAFDRHVKNIKDFAIYSKSIGAKFLFIDLSGTLQHPRMDDLKKFFSSNENLYFYDLSTDYKKQSSWKYDSHWDIKGNQEAGKYIYQHFKKEKVFK